MSDFIKGAHYYLYLWNIIFLAEQPVKCERFEEWGERGDDYSLETRKNKAVTEDKTFWNKIT